MHPRNICQSTFELVARFRATPWSIGRIVYVAFAHRITICIGAALIVLAFRSHWHNEDPLAQSADGTFHLQLNETAPLHCVFHWQCACYWFDETVDNHAHCLLLGEAAAHEVEQLLVGNL